MINRVNLFLSDFLKKTFDGYETHDKFYKLSAVLLMITFIVSFFQMLIFSDYYFDEVMSFAYPAIALTISLGVAFEFWNSVKELLSKVWVRWIGGVVSFFIFKFAQAQSDDFINGFTGVDPSFLSFSSSVLTAIYLPYSWLVLVSVLISIYFFVHWVFLPFENESNSRRLDGWKYFARIMGVATIFIATNNVLKFYQDPKSVTSMIAEHIVITTEYFPRTHCKNVKSGELSADIGGGYVSVFDQNEKIFRTEICETSTSKIN